MSEAEKNGASGQANINKWAELNAQLKITSEGVRALSKEYANNAIISQAQEGSLKSLRAQLSNLRYEYDNISRDLRNGTTGAELVAQIKKVNDELNVAEQATGRYQRNVGNYASAWNGLNVQVQQVARELPSLAYGLNTFISAIGKTCPCWQMKYNEPEKNTNLLSPKIKRLHLYGNNLFHLFLIGKRD